MTALHLRITRDLAAQIRSGVWPPGHRIPFEHELMASYRCARATANKAVSALVDAGLIERRRRAGSFVTGPRLQSAALEIPDLEAEITRRGQIYAYELASRRLRPADGREPDEMRLAAAGDLLDLRGRHLADGRPFAIEHRVINLAAAPAASTADFSATAPGAWLASVATVPPRMASRRSSVGLDLVQ